MYIDDLIFNCEVNFNQIKTSINLEGGNADNTICCNVSWPAYLLKTVMPRKWLCSSKWYSLTSYVTIQTKVTEQYFQVTLIALYKVLLSFSSVLNREVC